MGCTRATAIHKLVRVKGGFQAKLAYVGRLKFVCCIQRKLERDDLLFDTEFNGSNRDIRLMTVL